VGTYIEEPQPKCLSAKGEFIFPFFLG